MRNNVNSIWTEARTADLIRLWDRGYSCAQIAAIIGVTRNAVIGKANRLQLARHTRAHNFNGQKRAIDPHPPETPRASPRYRKPQSVFKSREQKPKSEIINTKPRPGMLMVVSVFTGHMITVPKHRRPAAPEMTKTELREMLANAVQNTAAMGMAE